VSTERRTSSRGFASMDEEKQRRIASKGGRSVPNEKRSFSLNRRLAAEAGRKGGQASHGGTRKRVQNPNPPPPSEDTGSAS
jgi:uncharacterized protein